MIIKVLGSAAGGGFPQVNCNCRNCADVRRGMPGLAARTQSSLAVSRDGAALGAPQRLARPAPADRGHARAGAAPRMPGLRSSPISDVVLTNGDVDHVAGLLSLREGLAFTLHATGRVLEALDANTIFNVLDRQVVSRTRLAARGGRRGAGGLAIEAYAVPGKVALYLEQRRARSRHARGRQHRPEGQRPGDRRRLPLHSGLRGRR